MEDAVVTAQASGANGAHAPRHLDRSPPEGESEASIVKGDPDIYVLTRAHNVEEAHAIEADDRAADRTLDGG